YLFVFHTRAHRQIIQARIIQPAYKVGLLIKQQTKQTISFSCSTLPKVNCDVRLQVVMSRAAACVLVGCDTVSSVEITSIISIPVFTGTTCPRLPSPQLPKW